MNVVNGCYVRMVSDLWTCAEDIHVNCSDFSFAIFGCNLIRSY